MNACVKCVCDTYPGHEIPDKKTVIQRHEGIMKPRTVAPSRNCSMMKFWRVPLHASRIFETRNKKIQARAKHRGTCWTNVGWSFQKEFTLVRMSSAGPKAGDACMRRCGRSMWKQFFSIFHLLGIIFRRSDDLPDGCRSSTCILAPHAQPLGLCLRTKPFPSLRKVGGEGGNPPSWEMTGKTRQYATRWKNR